MKVGIDILEVERINKIKASHLSQIFTENEINYANLTSSKEQRLAGIFCAKEAFLKALGIGVRNGIDLTEIEICHNDNGSPIYKVSLKVEDVLKSLNIVEFELSISHTDNLATAICIMK